MERRRGAAEDRRDRERHAGGVEQPALDDPDRRELILDRRREQEHVPGDERHGDLGERAAEPVDPTPHDPRAFGRFERDRVAADRPRGCGGVGERPQRHRLGPEHLEDHHARVRQQRRRVRESVDRERLPEVAARVGPRVRVRGRLGVPLQLVEPLIDETPLERRYDHEVRTGERAPDDEKQRDGEARADPAGEAHRSRKR